MGEYSCPCEDGPVECKTEGCEEYADLCQGMDVCWKCFCDSVPLTKKE